MQPGNLPSRGDLARWQGPVFFNLRRGKKSRPNLSGSLFFLSFVL
jgi:hypothetical protein